MAKTNPKQTSKKIAKLASEELRTSKDKDIKAIAASALSQAPPKKQTPIKKAAPKKTKSSK